MPDTNDIVYESTQFDIVYFMQAIFHSLGLDNLTYERFIDFLQSTWNIFSGVSLGISFLFIIGIIYAYIRYNQMGQLESDQIAVQERLYHELYGKDKINNRWEDIQNHIATDNPNDWKLAIIEADVMLEETLDSAGLAGLTIGDKLKSASPQSFETLDDAWKAHKVRNKIAHGEADFVLTRKMAQETVTQYKRVFQEFGVV